MATKDNKLSSYRPSASVIISSKIDDLENGCDYQLLLFKRTPQTAFAPEHCVFPGGCLDLADESIEWIRYFQDSGVSFQNLRGLIWSQNSSRPDFLVSQGTGCYDRFFKKDKIWARDISLRITAIRETFEEVGVLLCRKLNNLQEAAKCLGNYFDNFDREKWQQLVHNNANQFLVMCKTLKVIPDLWCLHEWSMWRSPATATKKFDTVFYFVALDGVPSLLPESSEVALPMWHSPATFLEKFRKRVIWLPYIIFYEVSRLTNLQRWDQLFQFACSRGSQGSTLMMPAYFRCKDGLVGILPGDDAYPPNPLVCTETISVDLSVSEFRKKFKNLHRVILQDMFDLTVDTNIAPFDGHLTPHKTTRFINKL